MTFDENSADNDLLTLFEAAIISFKEIDAQAKHQKKQVIIKLAINLEDKIPANTICMEITNQFSGIVSQSLIRGCLDEKYKQATRVRNAKLQKKKPPELKKVEDDLALQVSLNEDTIKEEDIFIQPNGTILIRRDKDQDKEIDNNNENSYNTPKLQAENELSVTSKDESPQQISKLQSSSIFNETVECASCVELFHENEEIKEALKKSSQPIPANQLRLLSTAEEQCIPFEFYKSLKEIKQYADNFVTGDNDIDIWFNGEIDLHSGYITSLNLGKKDQDLS